MSGVFDTYARYYDLLYREKDYAAEVAYIDSHIQSLALGARNILELGCGTGAHAEHLAHRGYRIHGVDRSEAMIARARERKSALSIDVAANLMFFSGDVRTVRTGEKYDIVISLFHVMSYQTANADLDAAFQTASEHLRPGGIFIFDFWYGPAVLAQQPEIRIKRLADDFIEVTRIAEPEMRPDENVVDVLYTMFIKTKATDAIHQVTENHRMRFFFPQELESHYRDKFAERMTQAWMTDKAPDSQNWNCVQTLVRI